MEKQDVIKYADDSLIKKYLSRNIQENFSSILFNSHENGRIHNSYDQELREQTSIERGDMEMLHLSIAEPVTGSLGVLSKDKIRNEKNLAIVVITLASRSAIRGGLSSEIAFSLCDSYINQVDECNDEISPMKLARACEYQYAAMVYNLRESLKNPVGNEANVHVSRCKNYIYAHLHDRITVKLLAEKLNLNANYLSGLFKRCEGVSLSQYIINEKINRARNLLIYSDYTYSEIATYLGFASQSHFGSHFKKNTGYTLRQYRNKYGNTSAGLSSIN